MFKVDSIILACIPTAERRVDGGSTVLAIDDFGEHVGTRHNVAILKIRREFGGATIVFIAAYLVGQNHAKGLDIRGNHLPFHSIDARSAVNETEHKRPTCSACCRTIRPSRRAS